MERSRERGDAGWLFRGIKPDGYECLRTLDSRGRIQHEATKDPERKAIFELMFKLALKGASAAAIQLEFSSLGYKTAPVKSTQKPRVFDVHRISQAWRTRSTPDTSPTTARSSARATGRSTSSRRTGTAYRPSGPLGQALERGDLQADRRSDTSWLVWQSAASADVA